MEDNNRIEEIKERLQQDFEIQKQAQTPDYLRFKEATDEISKTMSRIQLPIIELPTFKMPQDVLDTLSAIKMSQDVLDTLSAIALPFKSDHWKTVVAPYWDRRLAYFDRLEIEYKFILRDSRIILERNKKYIPDFDEFEEWFVVVRYPEYYNSDESIENLPRVSLSDFELFDKYKEQGLYEYYLTDFYNLFSIDGNNSDINTDLDQVFLNEWRKHKISDKAFFRDWLANECIKLNGALKTWFSECIQEQFLLSQFIKWLGGLTAETMPKEENGELFDIDLIKRINDLNRKENIFEPLDNEQLSKALNDPGNYGNLIKVKELKKTTYKRLILELEVDKGREWSEKISNVSIEGGYKELGKRRSILVKRLNIP